MAESSTLPVELNQEYRVKLGKSFTFPKENAFHSIKYDFKPKSVDSSQPGRLKVKGDEVSVFMPVLQAESAEDVAMFKGAGKPCRKECILIINTETGEAVLEKISNTVNLKGVRDLTKRKKVRSISPVPTKKSLPSSAAKSSSNQGTGTLSSANSVPSTSQPSTKQPSTAGKKSGKKGTKADKHLPPSSQSGGVGTTDKQQPASAIGSKAPPTSLNYQSPNLLSLPRPISPIRSNNPTPEPPGNKNRLSVSSHSNEGSDEDGSSSSVSGSDDSDSEMDQSNLSMPMQQFTSAPPPSAMPIFTSQSTNQSFDGQNSLNMPSFLGGGVVGGAGGTTLLGNSPSSTSGSSSSSSSSGSSSSSSEGSESSDDDNNQHEGVAPPQSLLRSSGGVAQLSTQRPRTMSILQKDLALSDSDDSDL